MALKPLYADHYVMARDPTVLLLDGRRYCNFLFFVVAFFCLLCRVENNCAILRERELFCAIFCEIF